MTEAEFAAALEALTRKIEAMNEAGRHACRADLHTLMERAEAAGLDLPAAARDLDEALAQDEIEERFDNLPL